MQPHVYFNLLGWNNTFKCYHMAGDNDINLCNKFRNNCFYPEQPDSWEYIV